jgi:hypothetical protein
MKKLYWATLALVALMPVTAVLAQQAVGTRPEQFVVPAAPPPPNSTPTSYLPTTPGFQKLPQPPQTSTSLEASPLSARPSILAQLQSKDFDEPDPNQDIAIQPNCGNWLISLNWSTKVPSEARALVMELRNNPAYRLNAYSYAWGTEERKAEMKRIEEREKQQREMLAQLPALPPDTRFIVPVTKSHFEIQYTVLVGGYKDMESAHRAHDQIRKLKALDPNKVKLQSVFEFQMDTKGKAQGGEEKFINPFAKVMSVPNPAIPTKHGTDNSSDDIALLRKLNANEECSLFKCPKKFTLAVKSFPLPLTIQPAGGLSSVMQKQTKPTEGDPIGDKASVLAKMLRKHNLEAYVLHQKYSSIVTVGSYDSLDDPRMRRDQERLPQQMHDVLEKFAPTLANQIKLAELPAPWPVPN